MPVKKEEKSGTKKSPSPVKKAVSEAAPKPEEKVSTEKKAPSAAPEKAKKPEPLVSFARWFRSKKFKPHWAAGMEAYTDTRRRRTMADWDRLFKDY